MRDFFGNLSAKLQAFLSGRNGVDRLGNWVLGAALILAFLNLVLSNPILSIINYALLIYFFFRVLSTNVSARRTENAKFDALLGRFKGGSKSKGGTSSKSKSNNNSHKGPSNTTGNRTGKNDAKPASKNKVTFTCDSCGQSLSVPKGRGKLKVTCPKCHHQQTIDS